MSKPITSIKRLALALCLATPVVSWATPTATAVWRSNLGQSYTIGGKTYAFTGCTVSGDGTVNAYNGAPVINLAGENNTSVSVLVKYSGYTVEQYYPVASVRDSNGYEIGCIPTTTEVLKPYWDTDLTDQNLTLGEYAAGGAVTTVSPVAGSGYMLFSFDTTYGSKAYMGSRIDTLVGGVNAVGHWSGTPSGSVKVSSLTIAGGENLSGTMIVEEVALFVGQCLSAEDVAEYEFPTVTVDADVTTMSALNTKVAALDNEFLYFTDAAEVLLDVAPSDATKAYLRSALWNGTVFIKDQNIVNLDPTAYGNKNSTLKLSGVSGHWGAAVYANTATPAIELEDSETEDREYGFFASNGYSFYASGNYYYVHTPELKGSGTYKANTTGNGALFVADKFDNFTGKLNLEGKTVWLGTGAPTQTEDTWNKQVNFPGTVRLGSTIPANYATWNVPNGYKGTVVLTTAADSTATAFLTATTWKGTCQLNWNATGKLDIVNYGNENSVIEIPSTFSALPTCNGGNNAPNVAAEIKLTGSWTVSDGWNTEAYRTTFAKLSGSGNLTVNGSPYGDSDLLYTITRLEGFTGTISGRRGKFTIGTIVAATEPTSGTKLVNITTSNAPVLDSTTVVYNNATQDVELEFKAGYGIYVKELPDVACIVVDEETTNYYKALTGEGGAIANTMNFSRVITLLANVEEEYELDPEAARPLKVKLDGFTWTGISAPDGYKVSVTYVEATGVTQYSCVVDVPDKARIGETGYPTVNGALEAVLQYNMAVGTVVEVLDSEYKRSDTSALLQQYFTWDSSARTWTRKATTNGEGTQTVTAATAQAACDAVTVLPTSSEVQDALGGYPYGTYFQKTAEDNLDGTWTVTVELKKSQIFEGDASETAVLTATLDGVLDDTADEITIPAKRGLYYSFKSGDEVTGMTEGDRVLATGSTVTLDKVDGDTFYQVLVNTAPKANN